MRRMMIGASALALLLAFVTPNAAFANEKPGTHAKGDPGHKGKGGKGHKKHKKHGKKKHHKGHKGGKGGRGGKGHKNG